MKVSKTKIEARLNGAGLSYYRQLERTLQKLDIMSMMTDDVSEKKKIAEMRSKISDNILTTIFRSRKGGVEICALDPWTGKKMVL